jgi:hypothetical protein
VVEIRRRLRVRRERGVELVGRLWISGRSDEVCVGSETQGDFSINEDTLSLMLR